MKVFLAFLFLLINSYAKDLISVSIAPQAFFVEKIAKNTVDINIIIPQNADEHSFEFKPNTILNLEKSSIYFTAGLEFENIWLKKLSANLKNTQIIPSYENIQMLDIKAHAHHHDNPKDPHAWLDPMLAKIYAKNITQALIEKYPQNKDFYDKNLANFLKELDEIHQNIAKFFANTKNTTFLVYHPSWNYFAKRYGLTQEFIEFEGKELKPKDLEKISNLIEEKHINTLFVPKGENNNIIKILAKKHSLKIIEIDHLSRNWEENLLESAKKIASSMQ